MHFSLIKDKEVLDVISSKLLFFFLRNILGRCVQSLGLSAFSLPHLPGIQIQDLEVQKSIYGKNKDRYTIAKFPLEP